MVAVKINNNKRRYYKKSGSPTITCKSWSLDIRNKYCNIIINNYFHTLSNNVIIQKKEDFFIVGDRKLQIVDTIITGNNGVVYLTKTSIHNKEYNIAIKMIKHGPYSEMHKHNFQTEIAIFIKLTNILHNGINPHFSYFYKQIKNAFIIEKASGTLFDQQTQRIFNDINVFKNILTQVFISIFSFHQFSGYYHDDTRYDNFLYMNMNMNIKANEYVKYTYNKKDYFLKASNYLVIIADYGNALQIDNTNILYDNPNYKYVTLKHGNSNHNKLYNRYTHIIVDYLYFINTVYDNKITNIEIKNLLVIVFNLLNDYNDIIYSRFNKHKNCGNILECEKELFEAFLNMPEWFLLHDNVPDNAVILNEKAYNLSYEKTSRVPNYEPTSHETFTFPVKLNAPYYTPSTNRKLGHNEFIHPIPMEKITEETQQNANMPSINKKQQINHHDSEISTDDTVMTLGDLKMHINKLLESYYALSEKENKTPVNLDEIANNTYDKFKDFISIKSYKMVLNDVWNTHFRNIQTQQSTNTPIIPVIAENQNKHINSSIQEEESNEFTMYIINKLKTNLQNVNIKLLFESYIEELSKKNNFAISVNNQYVRFHLVNNYNDFERLYNNDKASIISNATLDSYIQLVLENYKQKLNQQKNIDLEELDGDQAIMKVKNQSKYTRKKAIPNQLTKQATKPKTQPKKRSNIK